MHIFNGVENFVKIETIIKCPARIKCQHGKFHDDCSNIDNVDNNIHAFTDGRS